MKEALERAAEAMNLEQEEERKVVLGPAEKELFAHMFGQLENLTRIDGEDCLLGTVHIFGVPHHVTFVHVNDIGEPLNDPNGRLEDILAGDYDGQPSTVELPGFKGEWVIGMDPFR